MGHFNNVSGQQNVAMVGDRILTDVLFGNLNGNLTIWTSQIVTEKGDNKAALFVSILVVVDRFLFLFNLFHFSIKLRWLMDVSYHV